MDKQDTPVFALEGGQLIITHGSTFLSLPYKQVAHNGIGSLLWLHLFLQSIDARRVQSNMPRRLVRDVLYGPSIARKKVRKAILP